MWEIVVSHTSYAFELQILDLCLEIGIEIEYFPVGLPVFCFKGFLAEERPLFIKSLDVLSLLNSVFILFSACPMPRSTNIGKGVHFLINGWRFMFILGVCQE